MWNFINRNYWNVVIVLAVILALICGICTIARGDGTSAPGMTNVINVIFTPVKTGFYKIGKVIGGFTEKFENAGKLAEENKKLNSRIKELEHENARLDEYKNENERLRKLLEIKSKQTNFITSSAEVVGRSFSNWNNEFVINKGTNDGVDVGNVVIENGSLVGKVTMAGNNWARVTTLLDTYSSVSATVIRSGEVGIVEGDIKIAGENKCKLNYTAKDADIAIGDTLETSGLGKVFPQGIIIGKIASVESVAGQVTKQITVEIAADIYNLKEVLVVIG